MPQITFTLVTIVRTLVPDEVALCNRGPIRDFMHGDFEMFSRVWRSIESLFLTSGLRKNYAKEVGIRSVPQY